MQTPLSLQRKQLSNEDGSPSGHGTGTAAKAVGVKYGSAKASNLIVIKMGGYDTAEATEVFDFGTYARLSSCLLPNTILNLQAPTAMLIVPSLDSLEKNYPE